MSLYHSGLMTASLTTLALCCSMGGAMAGCNSGTGGPGAVLGSESCQASAGSAAATAVGAGALSSDFGGVAVGEQARALGFGSVTIGAQAGPSPATSSVGTISIGLRTNYAGGGLYATAIGGGNAGSGGSVAESQAAHATGAYSIAIGGGDGEEFATDGGKIVINLNGARATGFISTAIGTGSEATGGGSSAIGLGSRASGNDSAAYGEFSNASGPSSIAMGLFSKASASDSMAMGKSSVTNANAAVALGAGAKATKKKAVALGADSVANDANTVSIGSNSLKRRIVNLAPGVAANDAATVGQLQLAMASVAAAQGRSASAVPVISSEADGGLDDIRREVAELRALLKQQQAMLERQQQRIAELERRNVAAASAR
jgi:autotransporter adhesin